MRMLLRARRFVFCLATFSVLIINCACNIIGLEGLDSPENTPYDYQMTNNTLNPSMAGSIDGAIKITPSPFYGAELSEEPSLPSQTTYTPAPVPESVLRGSFTTWFYDWNEATANRAFNIDKAAKLIDGRIISPDEVFSFNETIGDRTKENGWKLATAFINGGRDTEDQYGGGICQVSTTLYNAVLRADLEIIKRHGHSKPVNYAEPGTDAAISGNIMDLVFKNNTSSDIRILIWVEDQNLHCKIYGEEFDPSFDSIDIVSELYESILPGDPIFIVDPNLQKGECRLESDAVEGSIYKTYKVFLKNGTEIRRELISETEYLMHPAVYCIGG